MRSNHVLPVALLLLGACARADVAPTARYVEAKHPAGQIPDLAFTDDAGRVVVVRDGEVAWRFRGILGVDGSTGVEVRDGLVLPNDLEHGSPRRAGPSDGLVPVVTDLGGDSVALASPAGEQADGTIAPGRSETSIRVLGSAGQWDVALDGNFVPEAFSTEPTAGAPPWLYVLEYLPAEAPTHYRVRLLDMGTGDLSWPVNLRSKRQTVDTQMAGVSRDQVLATRRGLLFTLYRGHHYDEDTDYAFVHTLAMDGGVWCLEIPAELDLAHVSGAVAVSANERLLYAASANGTIAEYAIDDVLHPARQPIARRTVEVGAGGDDRPVLAATDDAVVLAQGTTVTWLDPDSLQVSESRTTDAPVTAIAVTPDGNVVVAGDDGLEVLPTEASGRLSLAPGLGTIVRIVPLA